MTDYAYSVDQAAEILDCTAEIVAQRIATGDLPGLKFGRGWIIPCEAFRQRLNELALQEASERRKVRDAGNVSAKAIKHAQGPGKKPATRGRTPPPLPPLP